MNEHFKLLSTQDVLELNKEDLEKYINQLNEEFIDLDFENKKICKEMIKANNKLEAIMDSVEKIYQK